MFQLKFNPKIFTDRYSLLTLQEYNPYTKDDKIYYSRDDYRKKSNAYDIEKCSIYKPNYCITDNGKSPIVGKYIPENVMDSPIMQYAYVQLYHKDVLYPYVCTPFAFIRKNEKNETLGIAFWNVYYEALEKYPDMTEEEVYDYVLDLVYGDYKITGINPW